MTSCPVTRLLNAQSIIDRILVTERWGSGTIGSGFIGFGFIGSGCIDRVSLAVDHWRCFHLAVFSSAGSFERAPSGDAEFGDDGIKGIVVWFGWEGVNTLSGIGDTHDHGVLAKFGVGGKESVVEALA